MSDSLLGPAAPDFDDPLGLLRACHQRIRLQCDGLLRLASHIAEQGMDEEAKRSAGTIYRYFSTAGKHHHEDEEKDLFPHLARTSLKLADRVHRLRKEHAEQDALWAELGPLLIRTRPIDDPAHFVTLCQQFAEHNRRHADFEDEEILDVAQHILSARELKGLGQKMAERRGVRQPIA